MFVSSLHVYPVKSTKGSERDRATVEPWGLAGDRRWMIVDPTGNPITARQEPRLLTVKAITSDEPATVTLTGPHAAPVTVRADGDLEPVRVGRTDVQIRSSSAEAASWFSGLLGREVRLVSLDDPTQRPVNSQYGRADDRVSLADGYPLLLTATASLEQLNHWAAAAAQERGAPTSPPMSMSRFRPSVVVSTREPFVEDGWSRVRIGTVLFRVAKGCDRCVMTTIEPDTLEKGPEPLRTLARHRRWDGKVWFGVNLIPDGTGSIAVGDPVTTD